MDFSHVIPLVHVLSLVAFAAGQRRLPMDPDEWTAVYNKYRLLENATGMSQLVWNINLERLALNWAQRCDFNHTPLSARTNKDDFRYVGENLFAIEAAKDIPPDAEEVVGQSWVREERRHYDYRRNVCTDNKPCGHYTQTVWSSTCAVGCAMVFCKDIINAPIEGEAYLAVCHYGPAGNVEGRRPFELGRRCSEPGCACTEANLCAPVCREKGRELGPDDKPLVSRQGCENNHQLCVAWAKEGKCESEAAFMSKMCKASCDPLCADQKPPSFCVDKDYVLCGFLAMLGHCAGNVAIMSRTSPQQRRSFTIPSAAFALRNEPRQQIPSSNEPSSVH